MAATIETHRETGQGRPHSALADLPGFDEMLRGGGLGAAAVSIIGPVGVHLTLGLPSFMGRQRRSHRAGGAE